MIDYFAPLRASREPIADVQHFYRTADRLDTLADKIAYDPTSPHQGEYVLALQAARSLDDAALIYLDFLLDNTWRYGWYVHPQAVAAYRDLVGRTSE